MDRGEIPSFLCRYLLQWWGTRRRKCKRERIRLWSFASMPVEKDVSTVYFETRTTPVGIDSFVQRCSIFAGYYDVFVIESRSDFVNSLLSLLGKCFWTLQPAVSQTVVPERQLATDLFSAVSFEAAAYFAPLPLHTRCLNVRPIWLHDIESQQ